MADHQLPGLAEGFDDGQHVLVIGLCDVVGEPGHSVPAAEHQGVVFVFAAFQVGDHVVQDEGDARVGFDLRGVGHREGAERNAVFEKGFQILKQSHAVDGIDRYYRYFFCHDRKGLK